MTTPFGSSGPSTGFNFAAPTPPASGGFNFSAQATNTGSSPFAFAPPGGGTPSFGASNTPAANGELYGLLIGQFQSCRFTFFIYTKAASPSVILSPLRPAFLTHKNPQRRKIFPDMRPVGRQKRLTNLKMFFVVYLRVISVAFV